MDIEGAEYDVLYAASDNTLRHIERIQMEVHLGEAKARELHSFLELKGFSVIRTGVYLEAVRK